MIGDWMLNLRERIDHEPRLLPFVISAVNDENPVVSCFFNEFSNALESAMPCRTRLHLTSQCFHKIFSMPSA